MEVRLGSRGDNTARVLQSGVSAMPGEEHYVLIELRYRPAELLERLILYCLLCFSPDSYNLFVDGELQSSSSAIPDLSFDLITNSADASDEPVLYVGGIPGDLGIAAVPQGNSDFTGCLKDLSFNFRYITVLFAL